MSFKVYSRWLLTGVALVSLAACAADTDEADPTPNPQVNPDPNTPEASNTIVDIASANPDFSLLVSAVVKANLVEVLAGDDALTVFAPSNEAFAASGLDAAAIESLTEDQARQIVLYHAVSGTISSTDLSTGIVSTVSSLSLVVATVDGVELNGGNGISGGAKVVTADLPADNGTLHVIDRVLIPPTIADLTRYAGLTELGAAVASAGLAETLSGEGPFTVFAPSNEAFPDDTTGLNVTQILTYHVLSGEVQSDQVTTGMVDTLATQAFGEGEGRLEVALDVYFDASAGVRLNNAASVVTADIRATNGIVHVIDGVLTPMNIAQVASVAGFSQLSAAVGASDPVPAELAGGGNAVAMADALSSLSALTVFAPTDDAFAAAFPDGLPDDGSAILGVLAGHAIAGSSPVLAAGLPADDMAQVPALAGSLTFDASAAPPTVSLVGGTSANIVGTDIGATNGVVHVIDSVLMAAP